MSALLFKTHSFALKAELRPWQFVARFVSTGVAVPEEARTSASVRWMHSRTCPECGKQVEKGAVEVMNEACPRMWRKFHHLSDLHCPFFLKCHVRVREGQDEVHHLWKPMPHIKGRS
eukprot:gnl/MRDRNA2_/MRDRNA2_123489_c0_seq1.p1 gnl/MRDRNA2_/MRDRNA2_123489_c0~~gnl/MRDRNA2_/MRDRNA2_123489_c0_seq1.p1  ORF type:complete len:117 (-),score=16.65 gnl/MRDRNA2_/MRDRNA2_123489_c0_seq1:150-500(-)